jgi:hypothetical protein
MASIGFSGDTSGLISVTAPLVAGSGTLTLPVATGTILASTAVSASTTNTNTNKIAVVIGGTTYYILASTSAT